MQGIIEVGDIVFSKSHNKRGKVIKINHYDYSVLVEVIIKKDIQAGTRTTKLFTFALSDLKLFKFNEKKTEESAQQEQPKQSGINEKQKELYPNAPRLEIIDLTADTIKSIEAAVWDNQAKGMRD